MDLELRLLHPKPHIQRYLYHQCRSLHAIQYMEDDTDLAFFKAILHIHPNYASCTDKVLRDAL